MTNIYPKFDGDILTADLDIFPSELGNSWIFIHEFGDNHPFYSYMFCLYHNDDFPAGTVVTSPYFYHRYPDIYSLYDKKNEDGIYYGVRASVNPRYRRQGWWTWYAYLTRIIFWGNLGIVVDVTPDRNKKMDNFYENAANTFNHKEKIKNDGRVELPDTEMPRDVGFPYIWYNQRISERISNES